MAAGTNDGGYNVLANAFGFKVDIQGCKVASDNIRDITIDELAIDCRELTTGLDCEYRLYGPGHCHFGCATFTSACELGGSKELKQWFDDCRSGKGIRKNITVTLHKSDKTDGRSFNLIDCFPIKWSSVDFSPASTVQTETLTVKVGRIEFVVK